MDPGAIDWIADRIACALTSGAEVPPAALRLLLHRFAATGRDHWRDPLGPALSRAVTAAVAGEASPDRLLLLAEAMAVSADSALHDAVSELATRQRSTWPNRGAVAPAAASVEFCLAAGVALPRLALVADSVDELERMIGLSYEPGDGVAQMLTTRSRTTGDVATHLAVSQALLRAYEISGRLAYPMLAEELMLAVTASDEAASEEVVSLEAARVLARLASLQGDPEYRAAAVTRDDAGYGEAAERRLRAFDSTADTPLGLAAIYGLAVEEWLRLT